MGEIKSLDNYTFVDETARAETAKLQARPSNNHAYEGRDLSTIFTAEELHNAVASGDFSNIFVGDYWPITLSGTVYDFGGAKENTLNNEVFQLEVAGVNFYRGMGSDGPTPNHLLFCSRNLIPFNTLMNPDSDEWYNQSASNPWLGSHLYQTLNNTERGFLPLIQNTNIGQYIYRGANGNGMWYAGEKKTYNTKNATGWDLTDRGVLFLPTEREIWGGDVFSCHTYGAGLPIQWPIFAGGMNRILKKGDGIQRNWWSCSSFEGDSYSFCYVHGIGYPQKIWGGYNQVYAPICFLFA